MKTGESVEKILLPAREPPADVLRRLLAATDDRWRRFWGVVISGVLAIGFSIAFIDRPAATLMHATLNGVSHVPKAAWYIEPMLPVIAIVLAVAAAFAALSRRPAAWTRTLIACCLAVMVALVLKDQLKFVFGRTWPESWKPGSPSWIATGAYGFHPFHGGMAWASFPSGHTAAVTAAAAVLWHRARSLRWLWAASVALIAFLLVASDAHFVSDLIGGFYLGLGSAATVLALLA